MNHPKITIFAGHYGSGKTTLAVNYALALRKNCEPVALCDMDIVNPYFRTADYQSVLAAHDVELIASPYANTNVEMPWIPTEAARVFDDPCLISVIDLGGDDCGALALGRYSAQLQGRTDVQLWMVVNPRRPLTRDVAALQGVCREIEAACKLRFTGIVNNPNLGAETTADIIESSYPFVRELAAALGLPVVMTAVPEGIAIAVPEALGAKFEIARYGNRFGF